MNDNEDAEILCLEEDLIVLKVQGMEIFKCYYFLHRAEVLVSVFQIKRSVKIRAFLKIARYVIDEAHLITHLIFLDKTTL